MVEKGTVIPLWQHGRITLDGGVTRSPTLPNIPTLYEAYRDVHGKAPSGVMWETMLGVGPKMDAVIKTYHLPPGTSKEMVQMWREAMIRRERDPGFLAEWEKTFGEELGAVVASVELADRVLLDYSTSAPWHEFFRRFVAAVDR